MTNVSGDDPCRPPSAPTGESAERPLTQLRRLTTHARAPLALLAAPAWAAGATSLDDELYGGNQNDVMFGEGDDDLLYGGDGEDKLYGGDDDILCTGGATASGGDELFGGPGINYFVHDGGGADPTATIRRGSTNHCAPVGGWWPAGCTYVWATCL